MAAYGFQIQKALVTEVTPDAKVVAAMNDINAASREQIAAQARGEASKILVIKQAEAEAAEKKLRGAGRRQRRRGDRARHPELARGRQGAGRSAQ